jgi:hypothetical protein
MESPSVRYNFGRPGEVEQAQVSPFRRRVVNEISESPLDRAGIRVKLPPGIWLTGVGFYALPSGKAPVFH